MLTDNEIHALQGYLQVREFRGLEYIASTFSSGERLDVVEIGAFCGKSTVAIGSGLSKRGDGSKVYSIDWHKGSPENLRDPSFKGTLDLFRQNIDRYGLHDSVHEVVGRSENVVDSVPDRIDVLWIDGQHEYEAVQRDFALYEKKVKRNGLVLFHDAYKVDVWTGPLRVIREDILIGRSDYDLFLIFETIVGLRKRRNMTSTFDIDALGFLNYERYKHSRAFKLGDKLLNTYMRRKFRIRT